MALDTPLGVTCPVGYEDLTEVMSANTQQNLYDKLLAATLDRLYVRCKPTTEATVICRPSVQDLFHSECGPGEIHVSLGMVLSLFINFTNFVCQCLA